MGDGDPDWFSKWEDELPSPEELMPLTQTLITPDLALAFNIPSTHVAAVPPTPPLLHSSSGQLNSSAELDSGGGGRGSDEPARTLKRPRLVWTPQLHKRFVDAVAHLGIKNAVPKTIMQLMSVDGLTRENVASHLQKYRLYLKRMQGMSAAGGGGSASTSVVDADTDRLFASSPVPPHFLYPRRHPAAGGAAPDHFMPFLPVPAAAVHHHHMVGPIPASHHQMQQQYRHFGGSPLMRQLQQPAQSNGVSPPGHTDDLEMANGTQVLTLFPTRDH